MLRSLALLPLLALAARAQAPVAEAKPDIPEGWIAVDRVETVTIYLRDRKAWVPPLRTDLKAGLKELYEVLQKQFGLGGEALVAGVGRTGLFKNTKRGAMHLVVFDDKAHHDAWAAKAGIDGEKHYAAEFRNTIGVWLDAGKISPEGWSGLWHDFTHQFFHLVLFTGAPAWLNEGLAEYFAYGNKRVKVAETKGFGERLERLKAARDAKTLPAPRDLLRVRKESFKRAHADAAWVLVHMMITHSNLTLNNIVAALAQLEGDAVDKLPGVINDLYRYGDLLVTGVLGGADKMQAGWDKHLENLFENPEHPKKQGLSIGEINGTILPDANGRMDKGIPLTDPASGVRYEGVRFVGLVHYRAPWDGRIRVTGASEDRHKDRSVNEVTLLEWTEVKSGRKIRVDNETFPTVGGAAWGLVIVTWEPSEGGSYRTTLKFRYP
ncbi:MAG: hypothetical protein HYY18_13435 [Planctomycetes bacterium]|nr:hypothetical protein [Planctomycetota bacterium]